MRLPCILAFGILAISTLAIGLLASNVDFSFFLEETLNPRPIVGILAQELPHSLEESFVNKTSYIGAAYVKYIESAGARVVPVLINQVSWKI